VTVSDSHPLLQLVSRGDVIETDEQTYRR